MSQEQEKLRKKKKNIFKGICEQFAYTSPTILIPICKLWNSQTIRIHICTKVGSANLFLFLFAGTKHNLLNTALETT